MRKAIIGGAFALLIAGPTVGTALAAQPASPGCFGRDRAAYATSADPGMVGYYASLRAGDNGSINRDYRDSCGGGQ